MRKQHLIIAVAVLFAAVLAAIWSRATVANVPTVLPLRRFGPSASAKEVAAAMEKDGAVVLEGRATKDMVLQALDELRADRMAEGKQIRQGHSTQLWKSPLHPEKESSAKKLADDKLIMEVAEALRPLHGKEAERCIGNEVRLLVLSPGFPAGGIHRDVTDSSSIPLDSPLRWGLNVIWAADDFTEINGATRFVVGSHSGKLPQGYWSGENEEAESALQVATMPAGSAVLYYASTLHSSGQNRAETWRTGINFNYAFVDAGGGRPSSWW